MLTIIPSDDPLVLLLRWRGGFGGGMRYGLRMLMIALAVGPPLLAHNHGGLYITGAIGACLLAALAVELLDRLARMWA